MNINPRSCLLAGSILIVWTALPSRAQMRSTQVQIQDESAQGSPLAIEGQVSYSEELLDGRLRTSSHGDIFGKNISKKRILTLVARVNLPDIQASTLYDLYFSEDLIDPGAMTRLWSDSGGFRSVPYDPSSASRQPAVKTVTVEVQFVQFDDGSTFGQRAFAVDLFRDRHVTVWALKQLDRIYVSAGEQEFRASLQEASGLPGITGQTIVMIYRLEQESSSGKAAGRIRRMLNLAEERRKLL